jgi:ABC-2 type transport system permease protein
MQIVSHVNPFFFMIDGFRDGFLGVSDTNPWIGIAVLGSLDLAMICLIILVLNSGWKLKN